MAQPVQEFIAQYNIHLDEKQRVDAYHLFKVTKHLKATGVFNNSLFDMNDTKICQYFSNGDQTCREAQTGRDVDMSFFPPSRVEFKNSLKDQLNFISTSDSTELSFKLITDSITVVEKKLNDFQKFIYTFSTKMKDLLQVENVAERNGSNYGSHTKFMTYQTIEGILVPKKILFSNSFCKATLDYADVSFGK